MQLNVAPSQTTQGVRREMVAFGEQLTENAATRFIEINRNELDDYGVAPGLRQHRGHRLAIHPELLR
jgi:hypothetical protein